MTEYSEKMAENGAFTVPPAVRNQQQRKACSVILQETSNVEKENCSTDNSYIAQTVNRELKPNQPNKNQSRRVQGYCTDKKEKNLSHVICCGQQ